jgi:hypothetical protein
MNPQYYGAAAEYNKHKKDKPFSRRIFILSLIVVGFFTVITIALTIIGSVANGPSNDLARLAARAAQLQNLAETSTNNIAHPDLKKAAAEAALYLATNSIALNNAYGGSPSDSIVASETDATIATTLADAKKAGKHDAEFMKIMQEKIGTTLELAQKIQSQNGNSKVKSTVSQTTSIINIINDELKAINL